MRYLLLFIPLLQVVSLQAQASVILQGNASQLPGTRVTLTRYSDYITQVEQVLDIDTVSASGAFRLEAANVATGEYFLNIGLSHHSLILEPGHVYSLEIPDPAGEDVYYPTETDTMLLLYQISNLDYDINYFSIYNYEDFNTGRIKDKIGKFLDTLQLKYGWIKDPFFQQYKEYKIAVLASATRYKSNQTLFETYLKGRPVLYNHPQYMAWFNMFYTGTLNQWARSERGDEIKNTLTAGTPVDTLLSIIGQQKIASDPGLVELVLMKGLFELYYAPGFDKYKIENLVAELKTKTKNQEIKQIAEHFLHIVQRLKPGSTYIDFTGKNTEGESFNFSGQLSKPVYLTFFTPDDPESIREISAVKSLYDEFKKEVNFVSVCANCNYSSLQQFIDVNKLKWTFWLVDPAVEAEYEVVSYPTAFFINKEGTFIQSPALLPSAGISDRMYVYLKDQKRNRR